MGRTGIKIIAGAIKIYRQQENGVKTILLPVSLRLNQHHFFGKSVRSIGFFGVAVPDIIFLERDRREFGISADSAQRDESLSKKKISGMAIPKKPTLLTDWPKK